MKKIVIIAFALNSLCYGQQKSVLLKVGPTGTIDTTTSPSGLTTLYQNGLKVNTTSFTPAVAAKQDSLNWYTPERYGAVGDGTTDDAPAFNALMAAIPAGRTISLGSKNYTFNSTWFVTKSVKIIGAGITSLFKCGVNNIVMIDVSADYVTMRDFFMYNLNTPTSGAAIRVDSSVAHPSFIAKFTMDNITINQYFNSVEAVNAVGWTMNNCQINFVNYGVQVSATSNPDAGDSHISGCTFQPRSGFTGVAAIYQTSSGGLRIVNNKFNYNGSQKYAYAYYGEIVGTGVLIIAANSFENYTVNGIKLFSHPAYRMSNVSITGNEFAGLTTSSTTPDIAIDTLDQGIITGNTFTKVFGGAKDTAITIRSGNYITINNAYTNTYFAPVKYYGTNSYNTGDGAGQCSNSDKGTAILVAGTVTVSNSMIRSDSKIYVTVVTPGGTQGFLSVPTITSGTSFVINSSSASETSTVNWRIEN